uniref:Protein kinase domain-containing protein n=1 Tax=Panagrolaimus superbus TaxID=310955 RepID=A0A914Z226_9BILA
MSSGKRKTGTKTHTAMELLDSKFNATNCEATDIWSFGVTIWEIFNETEQIPYKDILKRVTEVTLLDYFYAKNHLETTYWPPKETSDALVTAESYMKRCLVHRQEFRPSFDKLWHLFETMLPEGQRLKCNDEKCEKSFSDFDSN